MEYGAFTVSRISVATPWAAYEGYYRHSIDEDLSEALESPHSGRYIKLTGVNIRSTGAREGLPSEAPFILINREHAGVIAPVTERVDIPPAFRQWEPLGSLQYLDT